MSSRPASVSAAVISVPLLSFYGSSRALFRSPATTSTLPLGLSLSAETTLSIVEVSSGER